MRSGSESKKDRGRNSPQWCQWQDKRQQAQTEIQETGLKHKKKLLFFALRVVKIRTGCPARLRIHSKHNWKRYWTTGSSWPYSDLQGWSSCSPDVPLEVSSQNLKIFVILWYLWLPYPSICSQISPFNAIFLSSSFKVDLPWLTASFLSSSYIFFYAQDLARLAAFSYSTCAPFQNYPSWAKIVISRSKFPLLTRNIVSIIR